MRQLESEIKTLERTKVKKIKTEKAPGSRKRSRKKKAAANLEEVVVKKQKCDPGEAVSPGLSNSLGSCNGSPKAIVKSVPADVSPRSVPIVAGMHDYTATKKEPVPEANVIYYRNDGVFGHRQYLNGALKENVQSQTQSSNLAMNHRSHSGLSNNMWAVHTNALPPVESQGSTQGQTALLTPLGSGIPTMYIANGPSSNTPKHVDSNMFANQQVPLMTSLDLKQYGNIYQAMTNARAKMISCNYTIPSEPQSPQDVTVYPSRESSSSQSKKDPEESVTSGSSPAAIETSNSTKVKEKVKTTQKLSAKGETHSEVSKSRTIKQEPRPSKTTASSQRVGDGNSSSIKEVQSIMVNVNQPLGIDAIPSPELGGNKCKSGVASAKSTEKRLRIDQGRTFGPYFVAIGIPRVSLRDPPEDVRGSFYFC